MTRLARTERSALCDLALWLGPDAATLAGGWTVKDLVVHLLVREGSPAAVGIVVPRLAWLTDRASARLAHRDFEALVARLREGPPRWSPLRPAAVDAAMNTLELFVHHEDVRRAQEGWTPRVLSGRSQEALWRTLRVAGRGLARRADVGVTVERTDVPGRAVLRAGPEVVVRGLPSELALFAYGRQRVAQVELRGDEGDVAALAGSDLGL